MRLANLDVHEGLGQRLRTLVMGRSGQPTSVGKIMSHPVQVFEEAQHAIDLVPVFFCRAGHHHIAVVDTRQQLVGIITQTDLVRMLAGALQIPQKGGATPAGPAGAAA
jgi:CBS domain-containing membrane protein